MILHLFTNKFCGHLGILVLEAGCFDGSTVDRERVVVEQFGVEVGSQRSAWDTSSLAHLTPWLKVLVVDIFDDFLEVHTSSSADEGAVEAGVDAKDLFEDLVDLLLVGVVLIGDVEERTNRHVDGTVPHGSGDIAHVDGAETEITRPHELHLLLEVLVDSSTDNTRSDTVHITRTVHSRRTKDDQRKASHCLKISLSLEVNLGKSGPGVSLVTLLGRLLASSINLSSAQMDELLDGVLHSLSCNLNANVMKLLLINGLILAVFGFGSTVENVVELLAVITSKTLGDRASVRKIALNEVHDGVGKESSVCSVEESGLREDLVDTADLCDSSSLHKKLTKVTANEASATENENGCHLLKTVYKKQDCKNGRKPVKKAHRNHNNK